MASEFIDNDTLEAVGNLWRTSPALAGLIPEPHAGKLKSPQPPLYCQMDCKLDRREPAGTGTGGGLPWHDYRLVTLTIVGVKARVVAAVETALAVFHQKTTLTFPSTDTSTGLPRFIQWWPLEAGGLTEDPDRKEGQDIWRGVIQGRVWSVRVSGS